MEIILNKHEYMVGLFFSPIFFMWLLDLQAFILFYEAMWNKLNVTQDAVKKDFMTSRTGSILGPDPA